MWSVRAYGGRLPLVGCNWCGERVRENLRGRRRRWCSNRCRMKVYRARKRLEKADRKSTASGDPLPGRGLYQLAQHEYKPIPPKRAKLGPATCRILGSALAAGVPRGKGPPFYLACRVFTGLWRAECRTSSAWRCVSVLSNTCCKWVRTVVTETDNSSEICLRSAPRTMRKATWASVLVRP